MQAQATRLPRFDGSPSASFSDWIFLCGLTTASLPDPERIRQTVAALDGPAITTFRVALAGHDNVAFFAMNWDAFATAMGQIFLRPEARHETLARVAKVHLEGTDLDSFIASFEAAIGVRPEALSVLEWISTFIGALSQHPILQDRLTTTPPIPSLNELFRMARTPASCSTTGGIYRRCLDTNRTIFTTRHRGSLTRLRLNGPQRYVAAVGCSRAPTDSTYPPWWQR